MSSSPRSSRVPRQLDRCEVCQRVLESRPDPKRRRCAEHLDQLHLFPSSAVRRPRRWPGRRIGGESR
ncbi:MAG: hypothetical protein GEV09_16560 [Pseudonocardiaceae bacterium]|nr:hypothetical protein [Pseudonocardiaceae bacterium]